MTTRKTEERNIRSLGVNAGCRKYNLGKGQYYDWLDRYNAHGLDGLGFGGNKYLYNGKELQNEYLGASKLFSQVFFFKKTLD